MSICRRAAITVGKSAASGVLGWVVLLVAFEATNVASAYFAQHKRVR